MNYDVIWPDPVRRKLLDFYAQAVRGTGRETAELNAALTVIGEVLQRTPREAGESREADRRVLIVPPISVEFIIAESGRRVDVISVHYSRGQRP